MSNPQRQSSYAPPGAVDTMPYAPGANLKRPLIMDTTLREGDQTPGVFFTKDQAIKIAHLLDDFGVDLIEVGHATVDQDIADIIKAVADESLNAKIGAHCMARREDIDAALTCDADWIGIFYSVSNLRLEKEFKKPLEAVVEKVVDSVQYGKDHGLIVRYTPEDAVRSSFENVVYAAVSAIEAGADRIGIADTVGCMLPYTDLGNPNRSTYHFMRNFKNRLKKEGHPTIPIEIHFHNDKGLSLANALMAIEAGADIVDTAVMGIGERAGITDLSQLCAGLRSYGIEDAWNTQVGPELYRVVSEFSNIAIQKNFPINGENAFAHCAGRHIAGVLVDPQSYEDERLRAEDYGYNRRLVIDKFLGFDSVKFKAKYLGIDVTAEQTAQIVSHIKATLEAGEVSDERFIRISKHIIGQDWLTSPRVEKENFILRKGEQP